jgi:hypothetical protein
VTRAGAAASSIGRAPANAAAANDRDSLDDAPPVAASTTPPAGAPDDAEPLPAALPPLAPTAERGAQSAPADTSGSAQTPAALSELPARAAVFPSPPPEVPPTAAGIVMTAAEAGDAAPAPWDVAADAGMAFARGSRKAATATSGFFTRLGNRIGSSF